MNSLKKSLALGAMIIVALGGLVACVGNQSVGQNIDDGTISTKIKTKFAADPEINPFNIDVDTTDGVVRLSGMVEDDETRDEAIKLAKRTEGVRRVINDIKIGERDAGDRLDDAGITARLKGLFAADSRVPAHEIDIDTVDGVVHLRGVVKTSEAKMAAGAIARDCEGVRKVENHLEIDGDS